MNATSFRLSLVPHRRSAGHDSSAVAIDPRADWPRRCGVTPRDQSRRVTTRRDAQSAQTPQGARTAVRLDKETRFHRSIQKYRVIVYTPIVFSYAEFTREYRKILARKDEGERESDGRDVKWRKKNDRPILEHSLLIRVVDADEGCSRRSPATSVYVISMYAREVP